MDFAKMLFDFRVRFELSQKEVAEILGTRQEDISIYETGKRKPSKLNRGIFENKMKKYETERGE